MNGKRRRRRQSSLIARLIEFLLIPVRILQALRFNSARWLHARMRRRKGRGGNPLMTMLAALGDLIMLPFVVVFSGIWHLIVEWTGSRESRTLLLGLPAVFIGVGAIGTIALARYSPTNKLVQRYERSANAAVHEGRWDEAKVYFEKLLTMRPEGRIYRFQVAIVAEQQGDDGRAMALMNALAPHDKAGFSLAHMWMATKLMAADYLQSLDSDLERRDAFRMGVAHLEFAIVDDSEFHNARLLLARAYRSLGEVEKSIQLFNQLKELYPEVNQDLAVAYRSQGNQVAAQQCIEAAIKHHANRIQLNPKDARAYDNLHRCLLWQEKFGEAVGVLVQGMERTGNQGFRKPIAGVFVMKCRKLAAADGGLKSNLTEIVENLQAALNFVPNSPDALAMLAQIVNSDELTSDEASQTLREALADARAPAMVHFLMGTKYAQEGNHEKALESYDMALELNPKMPFVFNNIAWVLCNLPDGPSEENLVLAMDYVNQAIEIDARQLTFFDTRGQVYLKMGDIDSAIADFYRALPQVGKRNPGIHDRLAECYTAKGETEQAQIFRDKASELRASLAENDS